jgi:hypothetical protein
MVAAGGHIIDYERRADRLDQHVERRQAPEFLRVRDAANGPVAPDLQVVEAQPLGDRDRQPSAEAVPAAMPGGDVGDRPSARIGSEPQPQKRDFGRGQPDFAFAGFSLEPLDRADSADPILCREPTHSEE